MNRISILWLLLICLGTFACSQSKYEKTNEGVIVQLKKQDSQQAKLVRINVISDKIIRITASPVDSFSSAKSIMAIERTTPFTNWKMEEKDDKLVVSTSKIKASISLTTGEVTFLDSLNEVLLTESQNGKQFISDTLDGKPTYQLSQVFESPADEAFYGLGQHQNGIINYKGKDADLTQYNTQAVIPFLVSSKNYGILWDNYSISKFGDPRKYQPISALKLYTADGKPGGLTATYYNTTNKQNVVEQRPENVIAYEFLKDMKTFPSKFNPGEGMVTWEGFIESDTAGLQKFNLLSAGYTKIWLDSTLVVDKWRQCWNPNPNQLTLAMEPGKRHSIRIEWIPDGGESYIALKTLSPADPDKQQKLSLTSESGDQIDYYFVYGSKADEIISGYREITGKATLLPKWAMGLWQSRERYKTQAEILDVVSTFRKKNIPIDNIVLDWQYWRIDQWGSHEFDMQRFPDPAGMIADLHNKYNTQIMISVWPKFYVGTKNYETMNQNGYLYTKNVENKQIDWLGYVSTFYDAYNPKAREMFWSMVDQKLFKLGIDGWWLDASEPDILSNISTDDRKELMKPTITGSPSKYFNTFSVVNASAIFDGQRKSDPDKRVFILTRSAYAGIQRYAAATWSGDIGSRWEELKLQIPAGINFSLSGTPYWTTDIGGFAVEKRYEKPNEANLAEWRELMTRWLQFGTFCPLFRVHGQFPYREMFNIAPEGHPAFKTMLEFDKLRYHLMPYIYSLAGQTYLNDYTIMRGLIMDFANDPNVYNINDQFMFGPSLLINPVYKYKETKREVYLPLGNGWYDLFTGEFAEGGNTILADAPLSRIPIYVKEGSILPFGPDIQYTTEKPADPITIYVYTGKDASFDLYEDENINNNFEKGVYSIIPISYNEEAKTLTIGNRKGEFPNMLTNRTFHIVWMSKGKSGGLSANQKIAKTIEYSGKSVSVKME
jgi:alpha-D-xyloside xylohydrolase